MVAERTLAAALAAATLPGERMPAHRVVLHLLPSRPRRLPGYALRCSLLGRPYFLRQEHPSTVATLASTLATPGISGRDRFRARIHRQSPSFTFPSTIRPSFTADSIRSGAAIPSGDSVVVPRRSVLAMVASAMAPLA